MKYLWNMKRGSEERQGCAHHTVKHSRVGLTNALIFKIWHRFGFSRFGLTKLLVHHGLFLPGMSDLISVKPQENREVCDASVFICT